MGNMRKWGGDDMHVHDLDCSDGFIQVYVCQKSNCILFVQLDVYQVYFDKAVKRRKKYLRYNFTLIRLAEFKKVLPLSSVVKDMIVYCKSKYKFCTNSLESSLAIPS